MTTLQLLGVYATNEHNGTDSWNIDSHQPDVTGWKAGRDDFANRVMGLPAGTLNAGQVFFTSMSQLDYQMQQAQLVYPNATDYIPIVGQHMYDASNNVSPATGQTYGWNDVQAYIDTANGLWDSYWSQIPGIMKRYNRPYFVVRGPYEYNGSFMPDFCGYNATPDQIEWHAKGCRRIQAVIQNAARSLGGVYPITGPCPTVAALDPDIGNHVRSVGSDVGNVLMYDIYDNFWLDPNYGGGGTPSRAELISTWDNENGGGTVYMQNLAKSQGYPLGIAVAENGASCGGDHCPNDSDDVMFWSYMASVFARARSNGVKAAFTAVWSIPASDANCDMQGGSQPNTVADFKRSYAGLIGDAFDPTSVGFGTQGPTRVPGSSVTAPSISISGSQVTPGQSLTLSVTPATGVNGGTETFTLNASLALVLANIQQRVDGGAATALTGSSSLTNSNKTLTLTQTNTLTGARTLQLVDSATGASSNVASYTIVASGFTSSPDGTVVATVGPVITNATGNVFSISNTGKVVQDGSPIASTANVVKLFYHGGVVYQLNSYGVWYDTAGNYYGTDPTIGVTQIPNTTTPGSPTTAPTTAPTTSPTSAPTGAPTTSPTSSPTPSSIGGLTVAQAVYLRGLFRQAMSLLSKLDQTLSAY